MSVKAQRSILTRSSQRFTGPPTLRQVIQFSYFLENNYPHLKNCEISKLIAEEITSIWQAVNPQLPLLRERYIGQKVNIFCYKRAKQIDRKSRAATKVKRTKEQLDKLFDISSCSCEVPVLRCDAFAVQCKTENCQTRHIVCTCPPNKKVPLEDRILKGPEGKNRAKR